jgi:transcriptional regulator with XRE-family HTH domain
MDARELNRLLKEKGITGKTVAKLLGISEVSVSRWRHGARRIHPAYQRLLALHLSQGRLNRAGYTKSRRRGGEGHGRRR